MLIFITAFTIIVVFFADVLNHVRDAIENKRLEALATGMCSEEREQMAAGGAGTRHVEGEASRACSPALALSVFNLWCVL